MRLMVRFLHTADWQLGMTRHFFDDGAQERYSRARFAAVQRIVELARERACEFVLVCGDVFETNLVERKTVLRCFEALRESSCPIYLLPGNHDPLDPSTLYRGDLFRQKPQQVRVIEKQEPIPVSPDAELLGAPWTSKRPERDLVQAALHAAGPRTRSLRILAAHGAISGLASRAGSPGEIALAPVEEGLRQGNLHYLALGDRHSKTAVGSSGRIWYPGTPEPTDYDELEPGFALLVDLTQEDCRVEPLALSTWRFMRWPRTLDSLEAVEALESEWNALPRKDCTVLKLDLAGSLELRAMALLNEALDRARDLLAAIEVSERTWDLHLRLEGDPLAHLALGGFAKSAAETLRKLSQNEKSETSEAKDALALLLRLAERSS